MSFENPACNELRSKIPMNWDVQPLDAVTDFQEGPGILAKDFRDSGVPLLRLRNIQTPTVQLSGCNFLDAAKVASKWKHFGLKEGDLLISTSASLGRVSVVGVEAVGAIAYTGIIRFRSSSESLHHEYLRAFLSSGVFVEQAEKMATGSVIRHFGPSHLRQMAITLPSLVEQVQVAEIYDALDDRITLLRETNATLEAIAQALFKSWFVDFEPVHAKMEGRAPEGMDEDTAALFPDGFEESGLGLVPKGWRVGTVGDFARQHKGSINPLQNPEVMFEHFSLPAFDNQQLPVSELGTEIKSNKTSVPPDAVLLSKLNPHIPRIWLPVAIGHHAVCSTEFLVFVPAHESGASKEFIYCAFTTAKFKELLCQLVTGTSNSHQRVKPEGVSTMSAVIPGKLVLEAYGSIVTSIFERIGHNRGKAQTLATLRDTLLPRLISGQLRLPAAQTTVAEEAMA